MQPWECPTDGPEHKDAKGNIQRRMFDWDNVFKGGEEWSFEEVRVRQRGLLGKEKKGEIGDWERAWHRPGCEFIPIVLADRLQLLRPRRKER